MLQLRKISGAQEHLPELLKQNQYVPFDAIEWGVYRAWRDAPPVTQEERETIERQWDAREFTEYPVTTLYPAGADGSDR